MSAQYARARSIRNTSFGDLVTKNLMDNKSIVSSVGSAISDKFKAKAVGIKERFDPLNIAKKLTGNIGATLYGKMTGRSNRDISYFTGIHGSRNEDPLYTKISDGQNQRLRSGDALADVVAKLYNLNKKYHIEDIERMEDAQNFRKIKQEEKEAWQKEVLRELTGVKTGKEVPTAKKEESGEGGETASDRIKKMIFDFVKSGPFLTILGILAATAVAAYLGNKLKDAIENYQKEKAEREGGPEAVKALQKMQDSYDVTTDEAYGLLGPQSEDFQSGKSDYDANVKKKQAIVEKLMADKGYKKGGLFGTLYLDKNGAEAPPELLKQVSQEANQVMQQPQTAAPKTAPITRSATLAPTGAGAGRGDVTTDTRRMDTPTATPTMPQPSPIGPRVQQVISENNNLQMESSGGKTVVIDNSKNINKGVNAPNTTSMPGSAPVRNDDDTTAAVQRMNYRPV
jgi:hypothetical protein